MKRVAALFVQDGGVYFQMPEVDPWPESRDARTYAGPYPVIAHPPCATWGRYFYRTGHAKGDDGGCFQSALESVRTWGGVLEHPAGSSAWQFHSLPRRMDAPDKFGGWSMEIFQSWYGHRAIKPTWLYVVGAECAPVEMRPVLQVKPLEKLGKRERAATPPLFAQWLVDVASRASA